eukprot:4082430-Alexandrium_andersonii.AAC.1
MERPRGAALAVLPRRQCGAALSRVKECLCARVVRHSSGLSASDTALFIARGAPRGLSLIHI